ncbi:UNVERIFIED_CONTAM: hypothetical protein Slati_2169900 [Sesamum latifolium]|uniref:Uncharacterized protein n=1 Tax=Sesamum latifolium TaxID=2727402 RepID=A0AAW2WRX2_9LAMI
MIQAHSKLCSDVWGMPCRGDFRSCVGGGRANMKMSPPPEATIDSVAGDIQQEGALELKKGGASQATDEGLPTASVATPLPLDQSETKEGPACGDEK